MRLLLLATLLVCTQAYAHPAASRRHLLPEDSHVRISYCNLDSEPVEIAVGQCPSTAFRPNEVRSGLFTFDRQRNGRLQGRIHIADATNMYYDRTIIIAHRAPNVIPEIVIVLCNGRVMGSPPQFFHQETMPVRANGQTSVALINCSSAPATLSLQSLNHAHELSAPRLQTARAVVAQAAYHLAVQSRNWRQRHRPEPRNDALMVFVTNTQIVLFRQ